TGSSRCSSSQRRSAPSRAIVCSGTIEPWSRSTSSAVYVRSMPSQRAASLIVVVPLAELGAGALGGLGPRQHLRLVVFGPVELVLVGARRGLDVRRHEAAPNVALDPRYHLKT